MSAEWKSDVSASEGACDSLGGVGEWGGRWDREGKDERLVCVGCVWFT